MHTLSSSCSQRTQRDWLLIGLVVLAVLIIFAPDISHASATNGGGLPYEGALDKLKNSITGPVAFTISVIAIVATGIALIFGGDMNGFFRSMCYLVLVISIVVSANGVMTALTGQGAVIAAAIQPLAGN